MVRWWRWRGGTFFRCKGLIEYIPATRLLRVCEGGSWHGLKGGAIEVA